MKKLIRDHTINHLKEGEFEVVTDKKELNELYTLKVQEELEEIIRSNHQSLEEFCDLIHVCASFARQNGFNDSAILEALEHKQQILGNVTNMALTNLNPENPSNEVYFRKELNAIPPKTNRVVTITDPDSEAVTQISFSGDKVVVYWKNGSINVYKNIYGTDFLLQYASTGSFGQLVNALKKDSDE